MNPHLKRVTIEDVRKEGPCGDYADRLSDLFGAKQSVSALSYVMAPIPFYDVLWGLNRFGLVPVSVCRQWALYAAELSPPIFEARRPGDDRVRNIAATRGFLAGTVALEDLITARSAAAAAAAYAGRKGSASKLLLEMRRLLKEYKPSTTNPE